MHKLWKDKTSLTESNPQATEMAQSYGWVLLFWRTQVSLCTQNGWLTTTCNCSSRGSNTSGLGVGAPALRCIYIHIINNNHPFFKEPNFEFCKFDF